MSEKHKRAVFKGKSTAIAVGLLIALGLWAKFGEQGPVRQPGEMPDLSELVGIKSDDVTRVELLHGGSPIVLAKSGKEWQLQKPVQARADDTQVKQLLDSLLQGKVDQVLAEKVTNYQQYGLQPPILQVTLADAKGHQKVLETGVKDVRGFSEYARTTDNAQVFLIPSYSVDDIAKKKPDDLRDKTALALDPNTINQVSIQSPGQSVRVEKRGAQWQVTTPHAAPADKDSVQQLLDQIKALKVDRFDGITSDPARYGLAAPQLTVTLSGTAGQKGLLLGKTTGKEVYAMRQGEPEVFELPKSALDELSKKPGDLRDKTLLSFKRDDATGITITTPSSTLELARTAKQWNITRPKPGKPMEDRLSTLLFSLELVKGSRVIEEKPADLTKYGLDKPQVRVQVTLPKETQELLIGKKASATDYYARCSRQEAVFTVPDFTVTDIKANPDSLTTGNASPGALTVPASPAPPAARAHP